MTLGSIPLAHAKNQALQANAHLFGMKPTLLARLTGATHTVADLLDTMPESKSYNTAKARRSMDKLIRAKLGTLTCGALTVKDCAEMLDEIIAAGKDRWAQSIRSRLIAMCKRGMQKGWMSSNPAETTEATIVVVKRERLSLEWFNAILEKAPQVAAWLPDAMLLAIVSGLDRSTIVGVSKTHVIGENLVIGRGKTAVTIAIPLDLRLDVLNLSLRDLVTKQPKVVTRLLVHHQVPYGNAPVGSRVHPDNISHAFTEARQLAGIPDVLPNGKTAPTFHEIRSLCKRLYNKQGNVDTKDLLGHLTERMADLYEDPRGSEPIQVTIRK